MCGIVGHIANQKGIINRNNLVQATKSLYRRGPDGTGIIIDKNVGLGHRRLVVIDPNKTANQPLFNEDNTISVVFNGEIYNYKELRTQLKTRGHVFRTNSDTEVIVHAWEEYGHDCVDRFRGMFSFCIYDKNKNTIFLARDRLGKKPLFFSTNFSGFFFASSIKALATLGCSTASINFAALRDFFAYGYCNGQRTIFSSIQKLPPAHTLTLNVDDPCNTIEINRYWSYEVQPNTRPSEEEWLEEMDRVLSESVRLRLNSDVPLGAFLSGGIDSSLIVAYMAKFMTDPVKTFTIGFPVANYDESKFANGIAKYFDTTHRCEIISPQSIDLESLVDAYDEPFGDSSAIPTLHLSQITRQSVTVALSGDGGDELFLGYRRYPTAQLNNQISNTIGPFGRSIARTASRFMPIGLFGRFALERCSLRGFELYGHRMGFKPDVLALLNEEILDAIDISSVNYQEQSYNSAQGSSLTEKYQRCDIENYLPEDILTKVDRASMYHSLEVRCPILDQEFVELSAQIPLRLKLSGFNGKILLKRLAKRHIPEHLLDHPKTGFGVPLSYWFKRDLFSYLEEIVADTNSSIWEFCNKDVVNKYIHYHRLPGFNLSGPLWRLLFLYYWVRANKSAT